MKPKKYIIEIEVPQGSTDLRKSEIEKEVQEFSEEFAFLTLSKKTLDYKKEQIIFTIR